jgi:ABC-type nitrate/sulfonate/bicarbonate transport system permease component
MTVATRELAAERLLGAVTVLALLALVEALSRAGTLNPALVPPPSVVAVKLWDIIRGGSFLKPLGETLYLLFVAYFAASALAIGVGLLMGRYQAVYELLNPLVELMRPLPKPALLPPLILFLGLGDSMKLTVVGLGVFFPVLINTVQGVRGTERILIDVARTFGHSQTALLLKVILPAAMPLIMSGMRVSLGLGLILVVIAEMLAGTGGVGYLIIDMQRTFRVPQMYAWVGILAVLGFTLNLAFVYVEKRAIPWSFAQPR